jgi:hypothetical protein
VRVNRHPARYADLLDWLARGDALSRLDAARLKRQAAEDGVTSLHLCMVHYEKGPRTVAVEPARTVYPGWQVPLADVRLG